MIKNSLLNTYIQHRSQIAEDTEREIQHYPKHNIVGGM